MGRKIPGKKHRGVKDPLKQHQKREAEFKNKINKPPDNPDDQPIPKSLEKMIELKNNIKNKSVFIKKKKKKNKLISVGSQKEVKLHPKARPDKAVPVFKQRPNESSEKFMHRVSRETEEFLKETAFEKKYKVEVKRHPKSGNVIGIEKANKDELDELMKLKKKHRNVNKKKKHVETIKLTKSQKKKQKILLKKEKMAEENVNDSLQRKEFIQFGETAQEPPKLTVKPRLAEKICVSKPGKKHLLLNKVFEEKMQTQDKTINKMKINKSGKRKDLPIAERRKLEKHQAEAIEAYRSLKSQKLGF